MRRLDVGREIRAVRLAPTCKYFEKLSLSSVQITIRDMLLATPSGCYKAQRGSCYLSSSSLFPIGTLGSDSIAEEPQHNNDWMLQMMGALNQARFVLMCCTDGRRDTTWRRRGQHVETRLPNRQQVHAILRLYGEVVEHAESLASFIFGT